VESTLLYRLIASITNDEASHAAFGEALMRSNRPADARDAFARGLQHHPGSGSLAAGLRKAKVAADAAQQ
jgi:hypothetical protein